MSKYFGFVNDKVYDYEFKRHPHDGWYIFCLDKHRIAYLIRRAKQDWSVIVLDVEDKLQTPSLVNGFRSRHAAIDYALAVSTITRDTYNKDRISKLEVNKNE